MPDDQLVFMMIGLTADGGEEMPNWGQTAMARAMQRLVFTEIASRWVPEDVLGRAWESYAEGQGSEG